MGIFRAMVMKFYYFCFYWTICTLTWLVRLCLFPVKIYGKENIPKHGSFILASNHLSNIDPMLIPTCCPRQLSFMAKESLFQKKFVGWMIRNLGSFPVRREEADIGAIREFLRRLKRGPVLIFPEGTRQAGESTRRVQPGIGLIVQKSQCPVVPVLIQGTDRVMPKGSKKLFRSQVTVRFGKPVVFDAKLSREAIAYGILQKIYEMEQ